MSVIPNNVLAVCMCLWYACELEHKVLNVEPGLSARL